MAATKTKKEKEIKDFDILTAYMEYVLEHDKEPVSVYRFCKDVKIDEKQFYMHFGSFDALKKRVWTTFFENTIQLLEKDSGFMSSSGRDKMLAFFFTFFELLTLNRSYVLFTLKSHQRIPDNLNQLKPLRQHFKDFTKDISESENEEKTLKILKKPTRLFSEGAWLHFMFLLKFWMDDDSPGFEKTDVAIEKSVNTVFDVLDNTPLDSVLDFGKFIWKEKFVS
ncbi:TetR family transcriptional regulator C-terminal domain-containing protein [Ascidiimonas aurantiaca]|uniref:TetR family transcriptional regulator C-terminal domain-containing protein n=1 Tax=Ascidiimonas aurantiaca TaxID=1685432 RepID=UPI0030EBA65E